ncbi:retrovirus-related Pol polyprotein from transposon 17.6 [Trichonephila clavipes]|nr:retrovirus-related Pol polyprotein from transposon 17.6 [Trichonephila clavipes]
MDPTKLSKNKMLLTGIGEAQVTTIGSFEHEFEIGNENYSLTWHVVHADKLKFEAVIGLDLLDQASINFTKQGVKFNKYENHAQLMQISAENFQEALDLPRVENHQIKKELENLIQNYKREKTASTGVTMRIILHDEEPVCQPPSKTSFHRKTRSKQRNRRMAQRRHYTSEFFGICKSNRNGHIVESGTIKPSTTKTLAVRKFPEPATIKQVQSFLGLTGYSRKYIKDYSKIAKPLSDLTRKENLLVFWGSTKRTFEKLKKIISDGLILHVYKYGRKTELHTDTCKQGYGAILSQEAEYGKLPPVYYMSKKTNTAEEKYDNYELEVLAIINALQMFRFYLLGQHFKIVTDCSAFQKTMQKKKDLITLIARWALQLEEFDYEIEHRAGSCMNHVDALSRYSVMIVCNDTLPSKLKKAQEEDDNIQKLKSLL